MFVQFYLIACVSIVVPFGSAILLPLTQLHAGHCGRHGNFRFHAIFSDLAWHSSYLMSLEDYLEERNKGNPKKVDVRAIVDKFERELLHADADEMKNFTRDQKFKCCFIFLPFHILIPSLTINFYFGCAFVIHRCNFLFPSSLLGYVVHCTKL